jgi:two-component system, OmpR family, alkaline phosphatase synthesis response regulator PhoP
MIPSNPSSTNVVMLVDDSLDLLEVFSSALRKLGMFTVICASNGDEALEQASSMYLDCMVIDIMMPTFNGFQLIKALRGDPKTRDIPLVILTALSSDKERFFGLASGADCYLIKPVTPMALIEAIRKAIAQRR